MTNIDKKKVITQWREFEPPVPRPRDFSMDMEADFVRAIIGPRRAGKTYACFQLIHDLLKAGTPRENLFYVNFEDEKLIGAVAGDMESLLETLYELAPPDPSRPLYLFLDEIQNVDGWQKWVRRTRDMKKGIKIVVTGSSAKLLSKELATALRGRVLAKEIFPLSFKELIAWRGVAYNIRTAAYGGQKPLLRREFARYLQRGGFPAAVLADDILRDEILQQYYDTMILNDVVERYAVRDAKKLKVLAHFLFESVGKDISYSKLANKMSSLGYAMSKNTVIEYLGYFEDVYLFFQNIKYEYSLAKQLGSIKKIYTIDNGLLNAVSFKFSENAGWLLENAVFGELRRRNKEIYYHRAGFECDFLTRSKSKVTAATQVTFSMTGDNAEREINGLTEAMEVYGLKEGHILTDDDEDELKIGKKIIKIVPTWKWMLNRG